MIFRRETCHFHQHTMELFCVIVLSIATIVTANTGSAIRPSKQDTYSVPVDVITELHALRSLQNQDSKITLDLGKQVMDLQKELHQLRTEYSSSLVQTKDTTLNLQKQVQDLQQKHLQLQSQYAASIQENQKLIAEIEALRLNLSEVEQKSKEIETIRLNLSEVEQKYKEIETLRFNLSEVEQKSKEIEKWKEVTSAAMADLTSGVNRKPSGGVFTRWGRTTCPANTSELVYSGSVGGSFYSHSGAAVNYLCLPQQPEWLSRAPTGGYAFLYGGEYDNSAFGPTNGDDIPCAVCRTTDNSVMMIPARVTCHIGWTKQYRGFLGAGYYRADAASEYVCVDENAEALPGRSRNYNGRLIYSVQSVCGSLPCPPYVNSTSVTCVVCSK